MLLLTSRKWEPLPVGKREVRNEKPLISPLTRSRPRTPQTFSTSNGIRMITQPRLPSMRSSVALNDLAMGLDFGIVPDKGFRNENSNWKLKPRNQEDKNPACGQILGQVAGKRSRAAL